MTAPIEDVSSLPGKKISDQAENPIGKVKQIYATDGYPMWVEVEMSSGIAKKRKVLIPLARIKDEDGELRVPYSVKRIGDAPEVDDSDGISAECDRELRDYYGIDTGDQEMRSDNKSYASLVPEEGGEAQLVEDLDALETPDADTRTDETHERLRDPGSAEIRQVTAEDVTHDTQDSDEGEAGRDPDRRERRTRTTTAKPTRTTTTAKPTRTRTRTTRTTAKTRKRTGIRTGEARSRLPGQSFPARGLAGSPPAERRIRLRRGARLPLHPGAVAHGEL